MLGAVPPVREGGALACGAPQILRALAFVTQLGLDMAVYNYPLVLVYFCKDNKIATYLSRIGEPIPFLTGMSKVLVPGTAGKRPPVPLRTVADEPKLRGHAQLTKR